MAKLIIKYQGDFIVQDNNRKYELIDVPIYALPDDYPNISLFIMFFCAGILGENYESLKAIDYYQGRCLSESYFDDDFLREINDGVYLYDLDKLIDSFCWRSYLWANFYETSELKRIHEREIAEFISRLSENLANRPKKLVKYSDINIEPYNIEFEDEEVPRVFHSKAVITQELEDIIKLLKVERTDKDVLLMYSGGRDSTLAALRLLQAGYNVYLIHFDNGSMRDKNKPFLTWKKSFRGFDRCLFPYQYSEVNIEVLFKALFDDWVQKFGDNLVGGTMTSEIRCLACRSAMYLRAIQIARKKGFKYIADGARISQKFMLEQVPMTTRFTDLARGYGIEVLYPVLDLVDDDLEKQELIEAGFSSKTWESKCLLGRSAMDKTHDDEEKILEYYDNKIKPKLERVLKGSRE